MSERIVVVEDDRELRNLVREILEYEGYHVDVFPTAETALMHLHGHNRTDLVITDLILPGRRGQELLAELRKTRAELNVIVITAFGSIESAIELVKAGAYDYLTKPFASDELVHVVRRGLADSVVAREAAALRKERPQQFPEFVGVSRPLQEQLAWITKAGPSSHPALITGESGTGKELVASALHRTSGRGPFVTVNCATIPSHLLESELFGHEKGAFTGADRPKRGLFVEADNGTLFLDEIGELPLELQPKLLRALESGEVRPVGAVRPLHVNVRLIAATNRDLEEMSASGEFRPDLYWRLNVLHFHTTPLRERVPDIALLAESFLRQAVQRQPTSVRSFSAEATSVLQAYAWPGNARELRNAIEQAVTMASGTEIEASDLPARVQQGGATANIVKNAADRALTLRDLERSYMLEVLRRTGGNKTRAAEILGLDRKTLYRKLQDFADET
jgi:DNA-binding NtrC family response regulator